MEYIDGGVAVGICMTQLDLICDGIPDTEAGPILSCNISNIDKNFRNEASTPIDLPGSAPNKKCFYYDPGATKLPTEIVVDTCGGVSTGLNAITGRFDYTSISTNADAFMLQEFKEDANCFCACGESGGSCRIALTVWRRFFCFGTDGQAHPGGKYWIDHYPALEYKSVDQTSSATSGADGGERFTFTAYTNPGYTGPADIIPIEAAADGYNACWYGWTSDECPPGDVCNCNSCGGTNGAGEPLMLGAARPRNRAPQTAIETPAAA